MRRIVLPQAIRIVIPAIGNEFIAMIKDSALVVVSSASRRRSGARSTTGSPIFRTFETLLHRRAHLLGPDDRPSLFQERIEKRLRESDVRI